MSEPVIEIPPGFVPLRFRSAYLGYLGPFYEARRDGQAVVGLGRRHLLFRVVAENPANEFAGLGLARLERADREGNVALIQSQLGLALILIRAVAPKTILRKNRPDLAVEAQPFRGAARGRPAAESGERDQQAGQRSPPAHKK